MPGKFFFFVETESHYVVQAGLEFLGSRDLPASAFQQVGITGTSHHTWPLEFLVSTIRAQPSMNALSFFKYSVLRNNICRMQWLMSVIPALWQVEVIVSPEVRSLGPARPTWQNPVSTTNTKINWAWLRTPVIPATQEAEAGESLDPRRWRLHWVKIASLHSSLGDRAKLHL